MFQPLTSPASILEITNTYFFQGKRKSSAKPQKKIKQKLDTAFTCLFCNHESSITCTIDKKASIGTLNCKICGQNFQCPINSLSEPVDIYSNWIDACDAVAEEENNAAAGDFDEENDDEKESYADNGHEDELAAAEAEEDDDYD